ncbi:YbaY family lipoprotein [Billgrantia saliphila]|uniref:YbaY family lipoprotein n=1 Tax=Billgrantia saliphila TaxID=1848458 RepID=UPI000CE40385|nr:YbaY family lipoprotein [Halomonas saliphila]
MFATITPRRLRQASIALGLLVLAGCAGTPDFAEVPIRVEPPAQLRLTEDAELRVRLSGADGPLAETHVEPRDSGPWSVVLRYDRRAIETAPAPRLSATLRQQGRLTHATAEPVALEATRPDAPISLSLDPYR